MSLEENMAQLPLDSAGVRLRRARETAGQSRADIARTTKISERMLAALEEGDYAALPGRTYATGFARTYARAVGLDAEALVAQVRGELDGVSLRPEASTAPAFEPGDPARVPSRRVVWIALGLLVLAVLAIGLWRMEGSAALPSILPAETAPPPAAAPRPTATPIPAPTGPVVLTAEAPDIWVRFSDGERVLLEKTMSQGEAYTVPADAADPRLRTARPDALAITIGGQPVPRLADRQTVLPAAPVSAAALLARAAPTPDVAATATPAAPQAAPPAAASVAPRPRVRPRPRPAASDAPAAAAPAAVPAPVEAAPANPSTATQ